MKQTTKASNYRMVKIEDVRKETSTVRTFLFRDGLCKSAKPGQFVMIWILGTDEIPMSLSFIDASGLSGVTVENVGEATEALHEKVAGDIIGVRGPFGNGFKPVDGRVALVGGGTGIASLLPLAESLKDNASSIVFLIGFRTGELLLLDRLKELTSDRRHNLILATEDGSYGKKGLVTDFLEALLVKESFDMIYTCGPEPMMRKVFDIAETKHIPVQACLERIIKCGVGLCGSCVIGKHRVCREGLVLSSEQLREIKDEFGMFRRDFDGRKMPF